MKDTWKKYTLGELLTESKIETDLPDTTRRIRVKLNVGGIELRPNKNDKEGATKYYIRKSGQFIYGKQNLHKGAFGIVPYELDGHESSSDIPAFDVNELCYPEWIFYYFKQGNFYLKLESLAKGVGSKRIQPKQLFLLNIFIPSKNEQKKILDYVRQLEEGISRLNTENRNQILLIEKLRETGLQEAIQGKLTEKWRSENGKEESGIDLLTRLRKKRREYFEAKKIKEEKSTAIKISEHPYDLPKGWIWCRFSDLIRFMAYGTSQKTNDNTDNVPVLRMGNVTQDGNLIYSNLKYINKNHRDLPRLYLEKYDLVFNRTNSFELVGKSAVYQGQSEQYTLASYLIKVSLFIEFVDPMYVNNYIISPFCRKTQIEPQITSQTNQANFSGSKLKNILFPLPGLAEQKAIQKKIYELMEYCNGIESQVNQSKQDLEALLQSVLVELFGKANNLLDATITVNTTVEKTSIPSHERLLNSLSNYEKNNIIMELVELLKQNGKMSAVSLWKMSKFENNIDDFYEEIKKLVEIEKTIKESSEKGFLELVK